MRSYTQTIQYTCGDPSNPLSGPVEATTTVAINPNNKGKIAVVCPGRKRAQLPAGDTKQQLETVDGENGKYAVMADALAAADYAVVRMDLWWYPKRSYEYTIVESVEGAIRWVIENAKEICGSESPVIHLVGFGDAGGAVAAACSRFKVGKGKDQIEKVFLVGPTRDAGDSMIINGLNFFLGHVGILIGDDMDLEKTRAWMKEYCPNKGSSIAGSSGGWEPDLSDMPDGARLAELARRAFTQKDEPAK